MLILHLDVSPMGWVEDDLRQGCSIAKTLGLAYTKIKGLNQDDWVCYPNMRAKVSGSNPVRMWEPGRGFFTLDPVTVKE